MKDRKLSGLVRDVAYVLESNGRSKHFFVASVGAVATFLLWWIHLTHPAMFANAFFGDGVDSRNGAMLLGLVSAPPFIMVHALGSALFFKSASQSLASGPMSGYLYLQESGQKWRVIVASGLAAAVNFMLMLVTAGPA